MSHSFVNYKKVPEFQGSPDFTAIYVFLMCFGMALKCLWNLVI